MERINLLLIINLCWMWNVQAPAFYFVTLYRSNGQNNKLVSKAAKAGMDTWRRSLGVISPPSYGPAHVGDAVDWVRPYYILHMKVGH